MDILRSKHHGLWFFGFIMSMFLQTSQVQATLTPEEHDLVVNEISGQMDEYVKAFSSAMNGSGKIADVQEFLAPSFALGIHPFNIGMSIPIATSFYNFGYVFFWVQRLILKMHEYDHSQIEGWEVEPIDIDHAIYKATWLRMNKKGMAYSSLNAGYNMKRVRGKWKIARIMSL